MKTMHARRQFWARHVQDWQASQLTQAAYCRQHDLKLRAFSYWLHRHKQDASPITLVPLAVQEPSVSGELLLQHANGWQLTLPAGIEACWLAGLLRGMV